MSRLACIIGLFLVFAPASAEAMDAPPNDGFVTDTANVLTAVEDQELEELLRAYKDETSNEIAVLLIPTLHGKAIDIAAVDVGREWGVGDSSKNNGIMMLIAYEDRKMFMAVGYGLEGAVPDLVAKGIIDQDITPYFREGEYAAGIRSGIESLQKHIGGEYTADRYAAQNNLWGSLAQLGLFFLFMFLDLIAAFLARSKSWWLGGVFGAIFGCIFVYMAGWWLAIPILTVLGLLFDYVVSKYGYARRGNVSWFGGGGGRRGGRGGFGGGGGFSGGSFGGGGAGGSW